MHLSFHSSRFRLAILALLCLAGLPRPSPAGAQIQTQPVVTTLAGGGGPGAADGPARAATFSYPFATSLDPESGDLFISDTYNRSIRVLSSGGVVRTLANRGLTLPGGIAADGQGGAYVADFGSHRIVHVDAAGHVALVAGGTRGDADGSGAAAQFNRPLGLVLALDGSLYVADSGNARIRRVTPAGDVTTLAGSTPGDDDGPFAAARFTTPVGLALDSTGNLLVADPDTGTVRYLNLGADAAAAFGQIIPPGQVSTIVPAGGLNRPNGIAVDDQGRIYVTEPNQSRVRRVAPDGRISTLAGAPSLTGQTGFRDGPAPLARFGLPLGLSLGAPGTLIVTDPPNQRVRRILLPTAAFDVQPVNPTVALGQTIALSATSPGLPASDLAWSILGGPDHGTVTAGGLYTAPAVLPQPPTVSLVVRSTSFPALDAVATVTVTEPPLGPGPAPQLAAVDPAQGAAGTTVTLTGSNFDPQPGANLVGFAGALASVSSASPTSLTVQVPAGAFTGSVTVRTSSGVTAPPAPVFTVFPAPRLIGFAPGVGYPGAEVVLTGAHFGDPTADTVLLGGIPAAIDANRSNDRQLVVTVPDGVQGSPFFEVRTTGGSARSVDPFVIRSGPTPLTFTPAQGFPGTTVTLRAFGLDPRPGGTRIQVGGLAAPTAPILGFSPAGDGVSFIVPDRSTSGPIFVTTRGGTARTVATYTVAPAPVVSGISPDHASVGDVVAIAGIDFDDQSVTRNQVFFQGPGDIGIPAQLAPGSTATQLMAVVPLGAVTGPVAVRNAGGSAFSAGSLTIVPTLASFSPTRGSAGDTLTIRGTGFDPRGTAVVVAGAIAQVVSVSADGSQIAALAPGGQLLGPVQVITGPGSAAVSTGVYESLNFTTSTGSAPPFQLVVAPGSAVAVRGTQFHLHALAVGGVDPITGAPFTGLIRLGATGLQGSVTAAFATAQLAPSGSTDVILTIPADAPAGKLQLGITGTAQSQGRTYSGSAPVTLTILPADVTTLYGRIVTSDDLPQPIPGVTVTLGSQQTVTDAAGNFILLDVPVGPKTLDVDGMTASGGGVTYPRIAAPVVVAANRPNAVPYTIFLTPQPPSGATLLDSSRMSVVASPGIPGLTVTLPAGTTVIDSAGNPVRSVSVSAASVDRTPVPLPPGLTTNQIYTFNPGAATIHYPGGQGVQIRPLDGPGGSGGPGITLPNTLNLAPGAPANIVVLGPDGQWQAPIPAHVSPNGATLADDLGRGIPIFTTVFASPVGALPPSSPATGGLSSGDPVDLATGLFVFSKTDLRIDGFLPIGLTRTYRQNDPALGPFGSGTSLGYDAHVSFPTASFAQLTLAGDAKYGFAIQPDGSYVNSTSPLFRGARIVGDPAAGVDLRFKDGTAYGFAGIGGSPSSGRMIEIADRNNNRLQITRGPSGQITSIGDAAGRSISLTYNGAGLVTGAQDSAGRQVHYAYTAAGLLASVTDAAGGVTQYAYDAQNRLSSITDPRGHAFVSNEYDADGRVSFQRFADGGGARFDYVLQGQFIVQTTYTDPNGHSRVYRFYPDGQVRTITNALGQTTIFGRDPATGDVTSVTDPLGRVTQFRYDAIGNLISTTDALGRTTAFTYQAGTSLLASMMNPAGETHRFEYDANGNLTASVDGAGGRTVYGRDAQGFLTSETDPAGVVLHYQHNAAGDVTQVLDAAGGHVDSQYDGISRLTRTTDPLGNPTAYQYDALGSLTGVTDAGAGTTTFQYDGNGSRTRIVDPKGHTTLFEYDALDRETRRTDPLGLSETFAYDPAGNLVSHTDRAGRTSSYQYDDAGRLISTAFGDGSALTRSYDAVGRLVEADDPVGGMTLFSYDAANRLVTEQQMTHAIGYSYDGADRVSSVSVDGVDAIRYAYDGAGRLTGVSGDGLSVTLAVDAAGRRTRVTLPNGLLESYAYDAVGRLSAITVGQGDTPIRTILYGYDLAGRRTSVSGLDPLPESALPGDATIDADDRVTAMGSIHFTYDGNGNRSSSSGPFGPMQYSWDALNRLIGVNGAAGSAAFTYDALNRRIGKIVGGAATSYFYSGKNVVLEKSPLDGDVLYLRGPEAGDLFARITHQDVRFYVTDALGSVIALADAAGALKTQYRYDSFGNVGEIGDASSNPYQFIGRENDGLGLLYLRARYYDPALGRFLSPDPTGFSLREPNLYVYAHNSPATYVDPDGLAFLLPKPIDASQGVSLSNGGSADDTSATVPVPTPSAPTPTPTPPPPDQGSSAGRK